MQLIYSNISSLSSPKTSGLPGANCPPSSSVHSNASKQISAWVGYMPCLALQSVCTLNHSPANIQSRGLVSFTHLSYACKCNVESKQHPIPNSNSIQLHPCLLSANRSLISRHNIVSFIPWIRSRFHLCHFL